MSQTGAPRRVTFRDVLANREFRALYIAQGLSVIGNQLALIAVAILVFRRTDSAALTAVTYAVGYAPWVLGGPILSAYADRMPRRGVMAVCDLSRTLLVLVMAIPGLPVGALLALLFVVSFFEPPFASARAAMLPDVVGEGEQYDVAATLSNTTNQLGVVIGFATGGAIVAALGARGSLLLDAATFAVSTLFVIRRVEHRSAASTGEARWLADLAEGARIVFGDARLRWLVVTSWLIVGMTIVTDAVAVPYAAAHGGGATSAGLLTASMPLGAVIGALVMNRALPVGRAEALMLPMALACPIVLAFTGFDPPIVIAALIWIVAGVLGSVTITANRVFVAATPRGARGRAFGIAAAGIAGWQGVGAVVSGLLADHVGTAHAVTYLALPVLALIVLFSATSAGFRPNSVPSMHDGTPAQDQSEDQPMTVSPRRADARVWAFTAALLGLSALSLALLRGIHAYSEANLSPLWILCLFVIGIGYPLSIEFRRQVWVVSLETVPFILGLVFLPPLTLICTFGLALLVTTVLIRRQPVIRWTFNVASQTVAKCAGIAAFHALSVRSHGVHPRVWPALVAAVICSEVLSALLVAVVMWLNAGASQIKQAVKVATFLLPINVVATFLAIATAAALSYDVSTGWAISVFLVLSIAATHTYHRLRERTEALDNLHEVAREMGPVAADPGDLAPALSQLRRIMRADILELAVAHNSDRSFVTLVSVQDDAESDSEHVSVSQKAVEGSFEETFDAGLHVRRLPWLPRPSRKSAQAANRLSTLVVAGERTLGVLSAVGRTDKTQVFERSDLQLLKAAADQLAAALEKGRLVESLRRAATLDSLTSLANLDSLREFLATMLEVNRSGVLLLFDIDRFHEVNDMLGHDAGDAVLVEVARRLDSSPSHGALSARVGSDQFALAIPGAAGSEVARLAALAVKSRVDGSLRFADVSADVRVTVGVARAPDHGRDAATLLRRAEMAMIAAKGSTGGIGEWEPEFERDGSRRLQLLAALRAALGDGSLKVEYQPKIQLGSGDVIGFEALVRWRHPEFGPVSPAEFVPLAEATGLIAALTSTVLRSALETCRSWHDAGKAVGVAVNISARSLDDPVLVGQVAAMLTASGLEPRWLTLEITESSVMENHMRALDILRQLRMLGVRLSIDDFGTGYSSLHQLRGLPVHEVKIDRSFVETVDGDGADKAVVKAVVDLCESLGLTSVAEGVETAQQAYALQTLRVAQVQGYFYGRPMTPAAAMEWLLPRRAAAYYPVESGELPGQRSRGQDSV